MEESPEELLCTPVQAFAGAATEKKEDSKASDKEAPVSDTGKKEAPASITKELRHLRNMHIHTKGHSLKESSILVHNVQQCASDFDRVALTSEPRAEGLDVVSTVFFSVPGACFQCCVAFF